MKKAVAISVCVIASGWAQLAGAGPWTKTLGEAYIKVSEGMFLAGRYVDPRISTRNDSDARVRHRSFTSAIYSEIGAFDDLHVQFYLPHVMGTNVYDAGNRYLSIGFGDLLLGAQWTPRVLPLPHALRLETKLPFYDVADPQGFEGTRFPARGDGQLDMTFWLTAGDSLSFTPIPMYAYGEIGHRFRSELFVGDGEEWVFADSFVFTGQLGATPFLDWIVAANANVVVPYTSDRTTKGYVTLGVSLFAPINGSIAFEASVDGVAWAHNSSHGLSLTGGVSYRL